MALLDCAINKKCCTVDGGRGICPVFSSPPRGICQLKSPHPREFAIQGKKNANSRGSARGGLGAGGIDWCIAKTNFLMLFLFPARFAHACYSSRMIDRFLNQSGISLNLRTGPTGHAPLFNQWDGALVFINKQIKTSPQSSKSFKTTDGVWQN